ncbi:MAG TPA: RHS repeat-associated core domain-containing protein, partial [Opitutaceae bacterium]
VEQVGDDSILSLLVKNYFHLGLDPGNLERELGRDEIEQYPKRLTDPLGNTVEARVDEQTLQLDATTDANGHQSIDRFDALGRVIETIRSGDSEERFTTEYVYAIDEQGHRVLIRQKRGGNEPTLDRTEFYSARGDLLLKVEPGEGDEGRRFIASERLGYTSRGQVRKRYLPQYLDTVTVSEPGPEAPGVIMRFDALGRIVEQIKPGGARIVQRFEPGRILHFDEMQSSLPETQRRSEVHSVDALGRVVAVERRHENRSVITRVDYDHGGRIAAGHPPGGGVTRFTYDLLGRLLREEAPASGKTVFVSDAAGNIVKRTTASGRTVVNVFDELNRLVESREEGAQEPQVVHEYFDAGDSEPADGLRNRRTRLWRTTDRLGTLIHAYDEYGQVVQTRRRVQQMGDHELVNDFEFDPLGRVTRHTLPALAPGSPRRVVETRYNARGLAASSPEFVRHASYDAAGRLQSLGYQNGTENQVDFDQATGRPQRHRVLDANQASLRDHALLFNALGLLRRIDSPLPSESVEIEYDELSRLTRASYGSGERFEYAYDDAGNLVESAGLPEIRYEGPAGSGHLTSVGEETYTYDADGHLSTAPYGNLTFDAFDNLIALNLADGRHMDFTYDHRGVRVYRSVGGQDTVLYPDPYVEVHDGQVFLRIVFAGRTVSLLTGDGQAAFVHGDFWESSTLFTDLQGAELARFGFGPYGTPRFASGASAVPRGARFTGEPIDVETGLICLGRRCYDPRLGRFISPDRVVGGAMRADSWNRYVYAHDNPFRYVDPTGRDAAGDVLKVFGIGLLAAAAGLMLGAGFVTMGATWPGAAVLAGALIGGGAGILGGMVIGGIAAHNRGGSLGHVGMFVSLESEKIAGTGAISLEWAVPFMMNAGVNHIPGSAIFLDSMDFVTFGEALELALDLFVPFFWITKLAQREKLEFYQTAKGELDHWYPKS